MDQLILWVVFPESGVHQQDNQLTDQSAGTGVERLHNKNIAIGVHFCMCGKGTTKQKDYSLVRWWELSVSSKYVYCMILRASSFMKFSAWGVVVLFGGFLFCFG